MENLTIAYNSERFQILNDFNNGLISAYKMADDILKLNSTYRKLGLILGY